MQIAEILVLAVLAGVIVYALAMRREREELPGTPSEDRPRRRPRRGDPAPDRGGAEMAGDSFAYVRVAVGGHTPLRTRLLGLLGLILLVAFSAALLAIGLWQAGHVINQTIAKFLEK